MGKVDGAALAMRALRAEGIDTIFTVVGDLTLPLLDASLDCGFRMIDTRHEAAALHMADAFSRSSGKPSVALSIGGPGHANAMAGLAEAGAAESPVIHISGRAELVHEQMGGQQEMEQVTLAAQLAKGSWVVRDARRVPEYVALAFRTALGGRPGPAHLSIPSDVQEQVVDEDEVTIFPPAETRHGGRPPGDPRLIEEAIALLARAERPVILAGAAARFGVDGATLQRFVELVRAPLFTLEHARGLVSDQHPLVLGETDAILNDATKLLGQADVVLLLGKRLDYRLNFGRPPFFAASARIIQVEPAPAEIGRNRGVAVGILGDVGVVVEQLLAAAQSRKWQDHGWTEELRAARRAQLDGYAQILARATTLHPLHVVEALRARLDERTTLSIDGGDFPHWGRSTLDALAPGKWLRIGPLGYLGSAFPFGMGAKVAAPNDPVVVLIGDGGLGFYFMEFETALRHNLAITVVVGNDAAWGVDEEVQLGYYGRTVASALRPVRYDRLVAELGGHGERVEDASELGPALDRARASGRVACVDVAIKRERSPLAEFLIARHQARRPAKLEGER